jgi:hypothetical protein
VLFPVDGDEQAPEATCPNCRASETGDVVESDASAASASILAEMRDPSPVLRDYATDTKEWGPHATPTGAMIDAAAEAGKRIGTEAKPAHPPRRPTDRRCCAPGCEAEGMLAKNSAGEKVARSAFLCTVHIVAADNAPALVREWASERKAERAKGSAHAE